MQRDGLTTLAESYAFDRAEMFHFRRLSERFIEQLRNEMALEGIGPVSSRDVMVRTDDWASLNDVCAPSGFYTIVEVNHHPAGLFVVETSLGSSLVDAIIGSGVSKPAAAATELEVRILLEAVGNAVLRALAHAFEPMLGAGVRLDLAEAQSQRDRANLFAKEERMAAVGAECGVGDTWGGFWLMMRSSLLRSSRNVRVDERTTKSDVARCDPKTLPPPLLAAGMEMTAVLATVTSTLGSLAVLDRGSVIPLGKLHDKRPRVELRCGGTTLFYGTIARDRGWHKFLVEERGSEYGDES